MEDYKTILSPGEFNPEETHLGMLPCRRDYKLFVDSDLSEIVAGLAVAVTFGGVTAGLGAVGSVVGVGVGAVAGALGVGTGAAVAAVGAAGKKDDYHSFRGFKHGAAFQVANIAQAYALPVSDGAKVAIGAALGLTGAAIEPVNILRERSRSLRAAHRGLYSLVGENAPSVIDNTLALPRVNMDENEVYSGLETRMLEAFPSPRKVLPNFGRSSEDIKFCKQQMEQFYDLTAEYRK